MKHESTSSSGMLLGMAAGAALGAVGVMAATQNQRQLRRTTRKVMKGAENAVLQLDKMVGDFVEKHMGDKSKERRSGGERRSLLEKSLLVPDAHAGRGVDLAQHAQIHLNVAGNGECLVHIAAGQHRGGHVLDGEHAGALGNIAGDGAGVGHITNGQAGQIAGDTHLAYLLDGQGERCRCRWTGG